MDLSMTEEQVMLRDSTRDFAQEKLAPLAQQADEQGFTHPKILKELAELGYFGMSTPAEYGGAGFDTLSTILALEEISKADASIGVMLAVTNTLVQGSILKFGSEKQKKKYVPDLANGKKIGAYCLTEPEAGSDAAHIKTAAVSKGEHFLINGLKTFITNGGVAEIFVVFAVTDKEAGSHGISAFIVEKGFEGLTIGKKENKMGLRASSTTELIFENCKVPKENLLGEEGQGFKIGLTMLDESRIGIGAQALGIAEGAYDEALKYSMVRVQFGLPICKFEAIRFMLADMATDIEAARLLVYKAAYSKDKGEKVTREAAMAKLFASEAAFRCVHKAVQIHGGYGYIKEYPVERYYRDQRVTEIYEGTSEIQRMVIANSILKDK